MLQSCALQMEMGVLWFAGGPTLAQTLSKDVFSMRHYIKPDRFRKPSVLNLHIMVGPHAMTTQCLTSRQRRALDSRVRLLYLGCGTAVVALLARFPNLANLKLEVDLSEENKANFWHGFEYALDNYRHQFGQRIERLELNGLPAEVVPNHFQGKFPRNPELV